MGRWGIGAGQRAQLSVERHPLVEDEAVAAKMRAADFNNVSVFNTRAEAIASILKWAREGDTVSLQIVATDPDGDVLSYAASGLPPGLAASPVAAGSAIRTEQ